MADAFDPDAYLAGNGGGTATVQAPPFDPDAYLGLKSQEPPNSEPPADTPEVVKPSDFPALSTAERSRTGELYDVPDWMRQESAKGNDSTFLDSPLIPSRYIQPAMRAGQAVATGGVSEVARALPVVGPIYKGVEQAGSDALAGFTSPKNAAMLALFPEGKLPATAIGAYFEAEAIHNMPQQWAQYQASTDPQEKAKLLSDMAIGLGLPLGTLFHTAGKERQAAAEPEAPTGNVPQRAASPDLSSSQGPVTEAVQTEQQQTQSQPEPNAPRTGEATVKEADATTPTTLGEDTPSGQADLTGVEQSGVDYRLDHRPDPEGARLHDMLETEQAPRDIYTHPHFTFDLSGNAAKESLKVIQATRGQPEKLVTIYRSAPQGATFNSGDWVTLSKTYATEHGYDPTNPEKDMPVISKKVPASHVRWAGDDPNEWGYYPPESPRSEATLQGQATPTGIAQRTTSTKNEVTDAERVSRDIAPAEEVASRDFGQVWDEAAKVAQDDPGAGDRLVEELNAKPRAVTDQENALLLRKQIETQTEFDNAVKGVNDAPDDATRAEAQIRLSAARDDLQSVYDANRKAGTETGRGLNARKMLAADDYSLAKMEARKRAANGGKPLNPRQLQEVADLHAKIADLQSKVDLHEQGANQRAVFEKLLTESKAEARQAVKAKRTVTDFLDEKAAKARERLRAKAGQFNVGVDPTTLADYAIIGASHIAKGAVKFADWSGHMIREFGDTIKPHLQDIWDKARKLHTENAKILSGGDAALKRYKTGLERRTAEIQRKLEAEDFTKAERKKTQLDREAMKMKANYERLKDQFDQGILSGGDAALKRYKTGLERRTAEIQRKLEAEDFTKAERKKTQLDREAMKMKANYERLKDQFDQGVERDRLNNLPLPQRAIDTFVKAERAIKLTGVTTFGKLAAAGVTRLGTTPIEEAVGGILSKIPGLSKIAEGAPREGGFNLGAELKAPTAGVAKGIKNIPDILRGNRTNEEALYGKKRYEPKSVLDIPGRAHATIKSPIKEAERLRGTIKREAFEKRQGSDITSDEVKSRIGQGAHQDALRSIFLQDNLVSDSWKNLLRSMEQSKKFPTAGYLSSRVGSLLLPIVKVPTNVALEAGVHLGGLVTGTGKLMQVMHKGIENASPAEKDMIMRHYKKGIVGAGLFLTGFFNAKNLGGFYQEGDKRNPNDLKWGEARVYGVTIPKWMLHSPAMIVMQAGATAYRVMNPPGKPTKGAGTGALAVANGLTHEIPFMSELSVIDNGMAQGYKGTQVRGRFIQGMTVPQASVNLAEWMDKKNAQGEPIKRYPQTEMDYVKMGVPGWREEVPTSKPSRRRY